MQSIYDIELNSAEGTPGFLQQYKNKVTMVVNTTVGCGNANQLEVLQWLQAKYGPDRFEIIAIPTNDYCGPGITKGQWSQGITCGMDSKNYGVDQYNVTFKYSEMVSSNPNELVGESTGRNGLGHEHGEPHELYKEIQRHCNQFGIMRLQDENSPEEYYSPWLNQGFYGGSMMGGNYEKYLIDSDGYVAKHYNCTVLNYDIEKTLKDSELSEGRRPKMGWGRSQKIFEEEYNVICQHIEELLNGAKSPLNPVNKLVTV